MTYQPLVTTTRKTTHLLLDQYADGVPGGPARMWTACGRWVTGHPAVQVSGGLAVSCGTCERTSVYRNALRRLNAARRTLADLKPGDHVGTEIVLRAKPYRDLFRDPLQVPEDRRDEFTVHLTGDGYPRIAGKGSDTAPQAAPEGPSQRALAEYRLAVAARELDAARDRLNVLLPKIPEGLTADLDEDTELYCPQPGCNAHLTAIADTTERSPVLGWGPPELTEGVAALWLADYEYGDDSTPVHTIQCHNGHAWRVPDHIDRNV